MSQDFVQVLAIGPVKVVELALPELLDSEEFTRFNEAMMKILDSTLNGRWVLDLTQVNYMGSSILGFMINIRQHIKSGGGKLALTGMSPRLMAVFHACCLEKLFTICKTREEAMKVVGKT